MINAAQHTALSIHSSMRGALNINICMQICLKYLNIGLVLFFLFLF